MDARRGRALTGLSPFHSSQRSWLPVVMTLPVVGLLVIVILLPEIWAGVISFTDFSLGSSFRYVGWENYRTILTDNVFWNAVRNNLIFVAGTVGTEFLLGLGLALLLSRGFPLQRLWISLIIAPYAISPVVSVVTWKYMLQPTMGLVNYLMSFAGLVNVRWTTDPGLAMLSVIFVEVWRSSPFMTVVLYAAVISVPTELLEAARVDGAGGLRTFWHVTLPLIRPAILVAVVFRLVFALRTFDVIWILTQGGPIRATEVLAVYLFNQGFRYWQFGLASATAWIVLVLTMLLSTYYLVFMSRTMFGSEQ